MNVLTDIMSNKSAGKSALAAVLSVALISGVVGMGMLLRQVDATSLTNVTDTLSDSDLSVSSAHTIRYTSTNPVAQGTTIKVQFDPTGDLFMLNATITSTHIIFEGATLVPNLVDCTGGPSDEVYFTLDSTATDENLTFTVCPTDTVPAGLKRIITATSVIANPNISQSYIIRIAGTQTDAADTRVAIIDDVVVTASVETQLTFTIEGLYTATTNVVNGEDLEGNSSATTLPFGSLQVGVEKSLGQKLRVFTNAANGFAVTVQQDGALRSQTGATIDNFTNGASTVTPIVWASPSNTLNAFQTYGHIGLTSEDDVLSAGDEFDSTGTVKFAGDLHHPRQVFYTTQPSNGIDYNQGWTNVAYKIEIGSLQEAATDYTMTLTYVCTPVF